MYYKVNIYITYMFQLLETLDMLVVYLVLFSVTGTEAMEVCGGVGGVTD